MVPRNAHMYLFMGKKSFPNFVFLIRVLTIQHYAETKTFFLEISVKYIFSEWIAAYIKALGSYLTLRNLPELLVSCASPFTPLPNPLQ